MLDKKEKWMLALRLSILVSGGFSLLYYFATSSFMTIIFYFTVQSNLLVFCFYFASLLHTYQSHKTGTIDWDFQPRWRGFITLMITITGLVFATILAPILSTTSPEQLGDFGTNQTPVRLFCSGLLHYYIPTAVIIDWVVFAKKRQYSFKTTLYWFGYPLAYIAMVYIRAPFISNPHKQYIYPFFNPNIMQGWLIPFIAFLWLFFSFVAFLYVYLDKKLR